MSLRIKAQGGRNPLLLIHGWGMHAGMWDQVAAQLTDTHAVHCVNLPGYGGSKACAPYTLDTLVQQLSENYCEALTVAGWSLGGQLALRWAKMYPAQVKKLVLVATTPCFVQKENWACAMPADTLQEFAAALLQNHALTLKRFLALQVRGSENEKQILSDLRTQLFAQGEPDMNALKGGLEILRDSDLRALLGDIAQPTLVIAGERDTLTPQAASEAMAQALPAAKLAVVQGAAHAPFLSHPQVFMQYLKSFLDE